jgi:hypothetical protein
MRGALAALDAPLEATGLEPFVTPQLCVAHLEEASAATPAGTSAGRWGERGKPGGTSVTGTVRQMEWRR